MKTAGLTWPGVFPLGFLRSRVRPGATNSSRGGKWVGSAQYELNIGLRPLDICRAM